MVTIEQLEEWLREYQERIARMLGLDPGSIPPISIKRGKVQEGAVAQGDDFAITVSPNYLKTATEADARGMVVHEGVHAISSNEDTPQIRKQVEPLADAIRYQITGTAGGWQPSEEAMRLVDLAPWQLRTVQATIQNGTFTNAVLKGLEDGSITKAMTQGDADYAGAAQDVGNAIAGIFGGEQTTGDGQGPPGGGAPPPPPPLDAGGKPWQTTSFQEARDQSAATIREMLQMWGIPTTGDLTNLIQRAFREEWNNAQFLEELRGTQEYRDRFPGIFDKDGTIKMSEGEYIQTEKAYESYSSQFGINMGPKRMAYLFRNDVTPDEFADRGEAFSRLNRNKQLYAGFKRELVQAGIAKPGDVNTNKELFKFVMGEGNKQWYDLWQDAVTRNAAVQAGISFAKNGAKYTNLRQGVIERISNMGLSEQEMAAKFLETEEILRTVLPTTEAGLYGVSKQDAVKVAFGGKGSSKARSDVERAMSTAEAFYEDRASAAVYTDDQGNVITQGVSDRRRRAQSDY